MSKIQAIIFDMDGTLVDNISFHKNSWLLFLKKHDILLDPEQFQSQNHGNIEEMIRKFFGYHITDQEVIELGQEKESIYRNLYKKHVREVDGLTDLLTEMQEQGIKAALATNSDALCIDFILNELRIKSFFYSISGGHEISKGKPDPEIFKLALNKMNLQNTRCIAIEDSIGGVISATQAGIKVIGITTSHTAEELKENGCFFTISNFKELDLNIISEAL